MSVHGPDPAFVGKAENLCGNMMFAGGMAKMRVLIFWTNVMRTENGFCIGVKSVVEPGDKVTGSIRNTSVFHTTAGGI